jgi:putative ABC transport system permease protein
MTVTVDYFRAMGIPLLLGRVFTEQDGNSQAAAIINQSMATRFWPDDPNPIGRRISIGRGDPEEEWCPIVGVVADVRHQNLGSPPQPELYVPYAQRPMTSMTLAARTAGDPLAMITAVRGAITSVDSDVPIRTVRSMQEIIDERLAGPRATAQVMGIFSLFALFLAMVGTYGVVAYGVNERTREIGIRLALGARENDVCRMILRQGLTFVLIGLIIGLLGALASMRVISSLLFGITPNDPVTYCALSLLFLVVAAISTYLPARRAMAVNPVIALRYE